MDAGSEANSVIVGMNVDTVYFVEYIIRTNQYWETVLFEIKSRLLDTLSVFRFRSNDKGQWTMNANAVRQFDGCMDIDISLTPFTNTLPINRLNLHEREQQQIKVLYIDILKREIKPISQQYTRLSKNEYRYENVPNDFESIIKVDEMGLVVDYPELFVRKYMRESHY